MPMMTCWSTYRRPAGSHDPSIIVLRPLSCVFWMSLLLSATLATDNGVFESEPYRDALMLWGHNYAQTFAKSDLFTWESTLIIKEADGLSAYCYNGTRRWKQEETQCSTALHDYRLTSSQGVVVCIDNARMALVNLTNGKIIWKLMLPSSAEEPVLYWSPLDGYIALSTATDLRVYKVASGELRWSYTYSGASWGVPDVRSIHYVPAVEANSTALIVTCYVYGVGIIANSADDGHLMYRASLNGTVTYGASQCYFDATSRQFVVHVKGRILSLDVATGAIRKARDVDDDYSSFLFTPSFITQNGTVLPAVLFSCTDRDLTGWGLDTLEELHSRDYDELNCKRVYQLPNTWEPDKAPPLVLEDAFGIRLVDPITGSIDWNENLGAVIGFSPQPLCEVAVVYTQSKLVFLNRSTKQTIATTSVGSTIVPSADTVRFLAAFLDQRSNTYVAAVATEEGHLRFVEPPTAGSVVVKLGAATYEKSTLFSFSTSGHYGSATVTATSLEAPFATLWESPLGVAGSYTRPPAVGNKLVYVALQGTNIVAALDKATGDVLLRSFVTEFCDGSFTVATPSIVTDSADNAFFTAHTPCIYKIDSKDFKTAVGRAPVELSQSPILLGQLALALSTDSVHAFDSATMKIKWSAETYEEIAQNSPSAPSIVPYGSLLMVLTKGSSSWTLWAVNAQNGQFVGRLSLGNAAPSGSFSGVYYYGSTVLVVAGQSVFVISVDFAAMTAMRLRQTVPLPSTSLFAGIAEDATLYVGTETGTARFGGVADASLIKLWDSDIAITSGAYVSSGVLYGLSGASKFVALNYVTGTPWFSAEATAAGAVFAYQRIVVFPQTSSAIVLLFLSYDLVPVPPTSAPPLPPPTGILPSPIPVTVVPTPAPTPAPPPLPIPGMPTPTLEWTILGLHEFATVGWFYRGRCQQGRRGSVRFPRSWEKGMECEFVWVLKRHNGST